MRAIGVDRGSFQAGVYARGQPSLAHFGDRDTGAVRRVNAGFDFNLRLGMEVVCVLLALEGFVTPLAALVDVVDDPG
jgi:hypothetical protein